MSQVRRPRRGLVAILATFAAALMLLPGTALAQSTIRHYGSTALTLNPATAQALTSLGVAVAPYGDSTVSGGAVQFPIDTSIVGALNTGVITHSGGITLTAGATKVIIDHFWIDVWNQTLSAQIDGGPETPIVNLDFSSASLGFSHGVLSLGPVTASLNQTAATALNGAFGVTALTPGLVLGQATVNYWLW